MKTIDSLKTDPSGNRVHILTVEQQNLKKKHTIISTCFGGLEIFFLQSLLDEYAADNPVIAVCTE